MIELVTKALFLLVVSLWAFYVVLTLYHIIFRPWRLVEDQLKEVDALIKTLQKGGWRAKFHSWISMPAWHGDVERHLKYLLGLRELKRAELELFEKLRR